MRSISIDEALRGRFRELLGVASDESMIGASFRLNAEVIALLSGLLGVEFLADGQLAFVAWT
jgi:hypothetical protein